jgi:hypothetical protein
MRKKMKKRPGTTLKTAMEVVSREVESCPDWLQAIYELNDTLDQYRRQQQHPGGQW